MAAEEGNNIIRGIYTGEEESDGEVEDEDGEVWSIVLPNVTHLSVHDSVTVIRENAFHHHPNIVELICHDGVKQIKCCALWNCRRLKRLIMPAVEEVAESSFSSCEAIEHIECAKLEKIRADGFGRCKLLGSINLPSAKIVEEEAFVECEALKDVKFGKNLDTLEGLAFSRCSSLERITIPLKEGFVEDDKVFTGCHNLNQVDFVEAAILQETMAALLMDEWKQDMRNVIGSINHILPNTPAGTSYFDPGRKARRIREWIGTVLRKIKDYKAQHRLLLNEAATIIELNLPNDIVHKNVLAFHELPLHAFDGEDDAAIEASTQRHTPPSKRLKSTQS